jgi:Na+/phosphate symporter
VNAARKGALLLGALFAFVLALELLKKGAGGIVPILRGLHVDGVPGGVGFGWLMACVVLSGSPVAAIALSLLASGALATAEAFAMVGGSRLGAAFVVLVIGLVDDLRHRRTEKRSAYIGVTALVATAVVYVPALFLGHAALERGWLSGLRLEGQALASFLAAVYGPITAALARVLPGLALFVLGVLTLLLAFNVFDRLLPDLQSGQGPVAMAGRVIFRPWAMFLIGAGVTSLTLSVSVSLSLLVPLAAKGYVRRENVWPYILGANITTFIDTLFAGALVGHPDAVRIVALLMGCVTALSLPIVLLVPHAFERGLDRVARVATRSSGSLVVFVLILFAVPALLLAL